MSIKALFQHSSGYVKYVELEDYFTFRNFRREAANKRWECLESYDSEYFSTKMNNTFLNQASITPMSYTAAGINKLHQI